MDFAPAAPEECAGLVLLQNNDHHFRFVCCRGTGDRRVIRLIKRLKGVETVLGEQEIAEGRVYLKVEAYGQDYNFYATTAPETWIAIAEQVDGRLLSTPVAGGFVGAYIGMYAGSNGKPSDTTADFDWFEYKEITQR